MKLRLKGVYRDEKSEKKIYWLLLQSMGARLYLSSWQQSLIQKISLYGIAGEISYDAKVTNQKSMWMLQRWSVRLSPVE